MNYSVDQFCSSMALIEANETRVDSKTKEVLRKTWTRYSNEVDKRVTDRLHVHSSRIRCIAKSFLVAASWADVHKALRTLGQDDEDDAIRIRLFKEMKDFILEIIDSMTFEEMDHAMAKVPELEDKERRAQFVAFLLKAYADVGVNEVDTMIDHVKKLATM